MPIFLAFREDDSNARSNQSYGTCHSIELETKVNWEGINSVGQSQYINKFQIGEVPTSNLD